MMTEPRLINQQLHPFVASAYITEQGNKTKVLVIHAIKAERQAERDRLYADFLSNLDLISARMNLAGEAFDRVDIRFH